MSLTRSFGPGGRCRGWLGHIGGEVRRSNTKDRGCKQEKELQQVKQDAAVTVDRTGERKGGGGVKQKEAIRSEK